METKCPTRWNPNYRFLKVNFFLAASSSIGRGTGIIRTAVCSGQT
jgi:hypothetical protein